MGEISRRLRIAVFVIVVVVAPLAGLPVGTVDAASGCTQIGSPTVISSPGCYVLTGDVTDSTASPYVDVQSSDVILDGAGHTLDGDDTSDSAIVADGAYDNVTLKNVVLTDWDYGVDATDASNVTVSNVTVTGVKTGLSLDSTPDAVVRETTVSNNADDGLVLKDGTDGVIQNVTADGNGQSGVLVDKGNSNAVNDTTATNNAEYGIYMAEPTDSVVSNATADGNGENGVYVETADGATVEASTARNNGDHGVYVTDSLSGATVTASTATGNGKSGFRIHHSDGVTVSDNTARSNTASGIFVGTESATVANNTLAQNDIGLRLKNHVHTVTGNDVDDSGTYGLYIDTDGNTIANNSVDASGTAGVYFASGKDNLLYNNYFNNADNVAFDGSPDANTWNVTRRNGANVVGGSTIGGNYWATPSGDGDSQRWDDADGDGILDRPHTVATDNVDSLPLTNVEKAFVATPSTHDFGTTGVSGSATVSVTVESVADADITLGDVRLTDADPAAFAVAADPSPATLSTGETTTVDVTFEPTATGTFTANLTLEADSTGVPLTNVTLTGTAADRTAPTADAGGNTTILLGDSHQFDGSASTDNVGITSYTWDLGDGTTGLTGLIPTHQYGSLGTYTATVTVADAAGNTDTDTVTITVQDSSSPLADAGSDRTVDEDTAVTFDGSGSTDDVGIANYTWQFGDGTTATGVSPTHTYADPGTYTAALTVEDEAGTAATDEVRLTVEDVTTPTARAGDDRTATVDTAVSFDGSASTDNAGIESYAWTFGDGSSATGASATRTYQSPGTYTATLTTTDAAGNADTDTVTVTVGDSTSLLADAGSDRTVDEGTAVTFDGTGSTDDAGLTSYEWSFGDGSSATGPSPSHTYADSGTYAVTLTVEDGAGNTATDTITVTVAASSSSGGGGGGGSDATPAPTTEDPPSDAATVDTERTTRTAETADGARTTVSVTDVSITDVRSGEPISVDTADGPTSADRSVAVENVEFTPEQAGDIDMSVVSSDEALADTPAFDREDNTASVSHVRVDHTIPNAAVANVTVRFRVSKARLATMNATAEDIALYRYNDTWNELPTELVDETPEAYVFRADSPGLSQFAAGAKQPKFDIEAADVRVDEIRAGNDLTVEVRIRNSGGADGAYVARLLVDDAVVDRRELTIAAGGTRQLLFDERLDYAGTYEVRVNDLQAGSVVVTSPAVDTATASTPTVGADSDTSPSPVSTPTPSPPDADSSNTFGGPPVGLGALVAIGALLLLVRRRLGE